MKNEENELDKLISELTMIEIGFACTGANQEAMAVQKAIRWILELTKET